MKKSLIALATLGAFAGAVSAQSSVTLYGLIDLSVQQVKSGDASPNLGKSQTKLADGQEWGPGSRWGLRVSEDLGAGLKANVVLESGFGADTGAVGQSTTSTTRLFGRQAFVSLASAAAGEVRLGRQYTFNDEVVALNNPFGNTTFLHTGVYYSVGAVGAPTTAVKSLALFVDTPRIDNAIQYISPSFGGFRVQGMIGLSEKVTGVSAGQDRYYGLKGVYANGPLNVALSYEQNKLATAIAGEDKANKTLTLGANYDFGVVRVFGGFQQVKDLANTSAFNGGNIVQGGGASGTAVTAGLVADKLRAYTLGVSVPLGAFTVGANYTRAKYDDAVGIVNGDQTIGRAAVGATYSLSKTTTVYTAYQQATGDLKNAVNEKRGFELGLRKAF